LVETEPENTIGGIPLCDKRKGGKKKKEYAPKAASGSSTKFSSEGASVGKTKDGAWQKILEGVGPLRRKNTSLDADSNELKPRESINCTSGMVWFLQKFSAKTTC